MPKVPRFLHPKQHATNKKSSQPQSLATIYKVTSLHGCQAIGSPLEPVEVPPETRRSTSISNPHSLQLVRNATSNFICCQSFTPSSGDENFCGKPWAWWWTWDAQCSCLAFWWLIWWLDQILTSIGLDYLLRANGLVGSVPPRFHESCRILRWVRLSMLIAL